MKTFLSKLSSLFIGDRKEPSSRPSDAIRVNRTVEPTHPDIAPQNPLEELLIAAVQDAGQRMAFQQEMLRSDLYAATPDGHPETREHVIEDDEQISLLNVMHPNGQRLPAVFTSEAQVAAFFGPGVGVVRMDSRTLLTLVAPDGAVLNPGGFSVIWSAEELQAVLGQPVRRTLEQNTCVVLGVPAERPEALIRDLTAALAGCAEIDEAWLALAHWPDRGDWSWYLDIRSPLDSDEINPLLSGVMTRADFAGKPIDVIVRPAGPDEGTGIRLKPIH